MIELTDEPIDVASILASVTSPECGAQVFFVGTTRRWTNVPLANDSNSDERIEEEPDGDRRETEHLIYEAYREMTLTQMQRLEDTARQRWPVKQVVLVHRLGRVEPTEASVAVAVSSPHRGEAFEAARWLIDELKHQVPIWKQEHYVQSGPEWIHPTAGNCCCHASDHHVPKDESGKQQPGDEHSTDPHMVTQVQQSQQ